MKDKKTIPIDEVIEFEDDLSLRKMVEVQSGKKIDKNDWCVVNGSLTTLFSDLSDKAIVKGRVILHECPKSVREVNFDQDFIDSILVKRNMTPDKVWSSEDTPESLIFAYTCKYNEADAIVDYLDTFLEGEVMSKVETEIKNISSEYPDH